MNHYLLMNDNFEIIAFESDDIFNDIQNELRKSLKEDDYFLGINKFNVKLNYKNYIYNCKKDSIKPKTFYEYYLKDYILMSDKICLLDISDQLNPKIINL